MDEVINVAVERPSRWRGARFVGGAGLTFCREGREVESKAAPYLDIVVYQKRLAEKGGVCTRYALLRFESDGLVTAWIHLCSPKYFAKAKEAHVRRH